MRLLAPTLLTLLLAAGIQSASAADAGRRETGLGPVQGQTRPDGVEAYLGLPYALPPVGSRRWRPPEPPAPWTAVRDARAASPQCVQPPYPAQSVFARLDRPQSEDCLYLNVWTTQPADAKAPVMVWIHGGGLTRGTGATASYDGGSLARKGVVLVTINYRLGAFGYFAHPELSAESPARSSGNQGYLDQIAALRWVRKHIAAFGGDPERVTIFGESAGSRSVNALMATPASAGLFHGAIGQSGAGFAPTYALDEQVHGLRSAHDWGVALQDALGVDSLAAMRALPAHEILAAAEAIELRTTTVVDGHVMPAQPAELFATGRQHAVPVIAGFNADEGTSLTAPSARPQEPAAFEAGVRRRFDGDADTFLELYPAETPEASWLSAFRDQRFGWETVKWADAMANVERPAWVYFFTHHPRGPYQQALRAYHAGEIRYVFDNLHLSPDADDLAKALADTMSDYWVSFAADGDPNGEGLPEWEAWDPAAKNYLEFGDEVTPGEGLIAAPVEFYDNLDRALLAR
ncbi:MAG: carboxylesterase family protein [Pseudomonadales bacterium]|jgi:para-nitrobenzyl esterase|nr:carboxylesterase family protein [Pseudomonadales bacterium]